MTRTSCSLRFWPLIGSKVFDVPQRTVKGSEPRGGAARSVQREDTALGGDDAAGGACLLTFRSRDVGRIKQMKDVRAGVSGRSPSIPCAVT